MKLQKTSQKKSTTSKKTAKTTKAKRSLPKLRVPTFRPNRRLAVRALIVVSTLILLASVWSWWRYVYSQPERVFWRAVNNALQIRSVSRQIGRNVDTQQPDRFLRLHTTPKQGVVGLNKYYQSGDPKEPNLVTEVIGTPEADYIRVLSLVSANPGQPTPDISSFKGRWAEAGGGQGTGQLHSQMVLGIMPFGNLNSGQRRDLIGQMQRDGVYKIDMNTFQEVKDQGRLTYGYNVSINTEKYVAMLQKFAKYQGNSQLEGLDPAQYRDSPALEFQFVVDAMSGQFIAVRQQAGEALRYHSYGLVGETVEKPTDLIPIQELQQKLQSIQ